MDSLGSSLDLKNLTVENYINRPGWIKSSTSNIESLIGSFQGLLSCSLVVCQTQNLSLSQMLAKHATLESLHLNIGGYPDGQERLVEINTACPNLKVLGIFNSIFSLPESQRCFNNTMSRTSTKVLKTGFDSQFTPLAKSLAALKALDTFKPYLLPQPGRPKHAFSPGYGWWSRTFCKKHWSQHPSAWTTDETELFKYARDAAHSQRPC